GRLTVQRGAQTNKGFGSDRTGTQRPKISAPQTKICAALVQIRPDCAHLGKRDLARSLIPSAGALVAGGFELRPAPSCDNRGPAARSHSAWGGNRRPSWLPSTSRAGSGTARSFSTFKAPCASTPAKPTLRRLQKPHLSPLWTGTTP